MKTLSPSLLACDFLNLNSEIKKVEKSGAKYVHLDIMDGRFVPNISFGMPIINAVRKSTDLVLDVHAMIVEPINYINDFAKCGADIITFHYEACSDDIMITKTISRIKENGLKVGISIKPGTDVKKIYPYLCLVDMVLVMTVEPGFGGQKFMPDMLEKIKDLRQFEKENGLSFDVEVDGGVNIDNLPLILNAGANIIVMGTSFFKSKDISEFDKLIKE